ncbi:MAG: hypothetical protein AAF108_04115 [Planctomycetota bacterium]
MPYQVARTSRLVAPRAYLTIATFSFGLSSQPKSGEGRKAPSSVTSRSKP